MNLGANENVVFEQSVIIGSEALLYRTASPNAFDGIK